MSHLGLLPKNVRVLDVGPGSGVMGEFLKERGISEIHAVETDEEARNHAAPIYRRVESSIDPFKAQHFDVILLLDVLEHMTDPFSFYAEMAALLTPGGKIFISLPNVAHWSVRLPLLAGFFEYTERGILDRTHYQFFTRRRFKKLLSSNGDIHCTELSASIEPLQFVLPKLLWDNKLFEALSRFRLSLAHLLPGFFGYQHLAIVEKRKGD